MRCKSCKRDAKAEEMLLEASGLCFPCAEELACMLNEEGFPAERIAELAYGRKPKGGRDAG